MVTPHVGTIDRQYEARDLEDWVTKFWEQSGIYQKVREKTSTGEKYYFLDGPPFPSSDTPHIGTCWNKIIKDIVIRFRRSTGYQVRDQPGYDCHGLPIELIVENKLKFSTKKEIENYGVKKFIAECKDLASTNSKAISAQFLDLGVWMDWNNPYMTHDDEYIESVWWSIKEASKKNLLEHGLKVVHWCSRCETVLSDYEVVMEYATLSDPSVFVKFPITGKKKEHILIWTTTPWTLPSNVAIMVNPNEEYSRVKSNDEIYIIATKRIEPIFAQDGRTYSTLNTFKGKTLIGEKYESPLSKYVPAQRDLRSGHRIVGSDEFVSLDEGTGFVHTAPGHGEEDFEVGIANDLPVIMLVDKEGRFTEQAGKYEGRKVRESNKEILEDLEKLGVIFKTETIDHRIPLCWRCKTPLIMRATDQWIIRVTKKKDKMIEESSRSRWHPDWAGSNTFRNWLDGLRDWVISRQRYWGTPIPIWKCQKCGKEEIVASRKELEQKSKTKVDLSDLHSPWVDKAVLECSCGNDMIRIPDVLVCWFDSGVASFASLGYPKDKQQMEHWYPADFIVEGRDQISGWFFSLLKGGVILNDKTPFESVLMHGFVLDENGREMHKSRGNYIDPSEVISRYGRDALRLFVIQNTIWEDLKFSYRGIEEVIRNLNVMWNSCVFAGTYMILDQFNPRSISINDLQKDFRAEDRWILSKTQNLIENVTNLLLEFKLHEASRAIIKFFIEDISHTYIRLIRRRTWTEEGIVDKFAAYYCLYQALKTGIVLLAPFAPFMSERIYIHMFRPIEGAESVHLLDWPKPDHRFRDSELETRMESVKSILTAAGAARMKANLKLRQPLKKMTILSDSKIIDSAVDLFRRLILEQANVKDLRIIHETEATQMTELEARPNFHKIGPAFKEAATKVADALQLCSAVELKESFEENGQYILSLSESSYTILPEQIQFSDKVKEGLVESHFDEGVLYLDTNVSPEEASEGLARDIVRRMQQMRKEMDLNVSEYVEGYIVLPDRDSEALLGKKAGYIATEVRAKSLKIILDDEPKPTCDYVKKWEIGDDSFEIGLKKQHSTSLKED